jgi:DNA-directed RNA polymerase subunit RPC12/RpoP
VLFALPPIDRITATVIANLIGGLIFFWVDRSISTSRSLDVQWAVQESTVCVDCGRKSRGYLIVRTKEYDRSHVAAPEFRCEECSMRKTEELRQKGTTSR